jgi:class 3 adenylate cyclase
MLVVWVSYTTQRNNTLKLVAESAHQSLSHVRRDLHAHLRPVMTQTKWVADLIAVAEIQPEDHQRLGDLLLGAIAATPQVTALAFISDSGQVFRAYRGVAGTGWRLDSDPPKDTAFANRTLERARLQPGGFWNEILYSEGQKRSFINFVQPIVRGEQVSGAVLAAVSLNELSDLVSEISSRMRGTAFILAGKDKVIAHPNLTSPHPDLSKQTTTVDIGRVGDLVLTQFWSAQSHPIALELDLEDVSIREAAVADQRYVFISGPVRGYGDPPWVIGGYIDAQTAEAPLQSVRKVLMFGVAAAAVGATLAALLGHAISRPITEASRGISRIAELEIEQVRELPRSHITELDNQALAFNSALRALRWFATYVPRSLVNQLIQIGDQEVKSRQQRLTVLFTDLVGFTSDSEKMSAAETAAFLNRHFALVAACVEQEGGTIDKFMGDALMAFWGAPIKQADHAARAVRAACAIARAVHQDNLQRRTAGEKPIRMRIGLHTGPAVVGNIGAPGRMNYTVVGDSVNTAQRMEQLGRDIASDAEIIILVTGDVVNEADQDFAYEPVGAAKPKGKTKRIEVFRVLVD